MADVVGLDQDTTEGVNQLTDKQLTFTIQETQTHTHTCTRVHVCVRPFGVWLNCLGAAGVLVPGGSFANFQAMVLARHHHFPHVRLDGWKPVSEEPQVQRGNGNAGGGRD